MPGVTPGPNKHIGEQSDLLAPVGGDIPRMHRTRRTVVCVMLILLLLVVGTGAFYLAFLNHTITANVKHEALLPTPSAGETPPVEDPAVNGPSPKVAMNILLIGSDTMTGAARGRSDVIVLVHISADRKKVYLVHFPRDMYVDVAGHDKDKINASYAYGGSQLLIRTLRTLVDVPIDHAAVIGSRGFMAVTDAVGGVDVYAEEASSDEVYINEERTEKVFNAIHVGINHLDGKAALAFVQERYQLSEGDISRGRRELAFIKALMLKILSKETLANPIRFVALVNAVARNLTVDTAFSVSEIYRDALSLKDLRGDDIVFITAPITGFGRSPQGASIDIVDKVKMAQLSSALKTDDMSSFVADQ